jgi:selenocysteine lyase/cysteine desulfurase
MPSTPPIPRDAFELPPGLLWLAHCKDGVLPRASAEAMAAILRTELRPWELRWREDFVDVQQHLREAGAELLGVQAGDVSLVTCTSAGLEVVALGFPWSPGDEVLIPAGEFPSNRLPWLALAGRGVRCREIELWEGQARGLPPPAGLGDAPERRLAEAIGPATRIVAVSWVRFQDGLMLDLGALGRACRGRGAALVVDGIQGAGTAVPDLAGVSAFATGGHKGLLGLQGQGLLWTDPAFRARLLPLGTWLSLDEASTADGPAALAADGRRLEAGSPSVVGCAALLASLRLLRDSGGPARIQRHVAGLQRELLARLAGCPAWAGETARLAALHAAGRLGSVLAFHYGAAGEDSIAELLARGRAEGIEASQRLGYLRVALHGWHEAADAARAAHWLASVRPWA